MPAYQAGDEISARQNRAELSSNVNAISLALGASAAVLGGVQRELGGAPTENQDLLTPLSSVQDNTDALEAEDTASDAQKEQRATEIEKDLAVLDERLSEFTSIDANVLVRPFTSEARSTAAVQPDALQFFAPAVVALLLQHLAITFAALSIVRERSVGTMELFRVSPLTAGETLLGKYLSYMIFGGILTAILISLLVYGLKVPMLGNWWNIVLVVGALLFTSLGIGFILSLISQTDSQAVQYTMLTLLTAVFFSGFILTLDMIWQPVRVVSWALPTTYGIILLRDIMLRGIAPNMMLVGGLIALGVGLCILAWIMLRRMITTREKESD
jgi:ABC-2 type transport system permease protein